MIRRLRDQNGIALIFALGVLIVISITTIALLSYSSSGVRTIRYDDARQKAAAAAEGGLNEAASVINHCAANPMSCDVRDPSALPAGSDTFDGSSTSWTGSVNGDTWTFTSTATVKNPSGGADVHKTASTQFRVGVDGQGLAPAWQYTYADAPSCLTLENSTQIAVPFYIAGDLCLKNSANPIADEITVKGHITLRNSSMIGSPSKPITALHTSGCSTSDNGPWTLANCTPANHVYTTTVDSTFANVSKPAADFNYWYAYSKPGPKNNCTSGSVPGGFDNNTTLDHSLGDIQLLGSTAYSCTFTAGPSTIGKIAWTPGSPGNLQVSGVLFFDGNLKFDNTDQAVYSGRATIYTSGKIEFKNSAYLCGAASCNATAWDGDNNMITFVAEGCKTFSAGSCTSYEDDTFVTHDSTKFQGGVWAYNDAKQEQSSLIEGPTIARQIYLKNSAVAQVWPSIDFVSYGAPAPIGSVTLVPISGTFSD
jgi:Tfp pilus assembly protein PilX